MLVPNVFFGEVEMAVQAVLDGCSVTERGRGLTTAIEQCPWFYRPNGVTRPTLRLFCFPYACGGATIFRTWPDHLPADVEVAAIALPGRGARRQEPPIECLTELIDSLSSLIVAVSDCPYAFFGHSMGALLAYEVAHKIKQMGVTGPRLLCLSGRHAPHTQMAQQKPALTSDREIVRRLRKLNGTPEAILRDPGLLDLILPVFRADLKILHQWRAEDRQPLDIPITAVGGQVDPTVELDSIKAWRQHTRGEFNFRSFPGDHFFLHEFERPLVRMISDFLLADNVENLPAA